MEIPSQGHKIYGLLFAVSIITISMLGSQPLLHKAMSQGQVNNSNNTTATSSTTQTPSSNNNNNNNTAALSSSSSVSIHLSKGYVNGRIAYFIATDASDSQIAASITNNTGFKVNFAPNLALTPESARQQGYDFINGIKTSDESPIGFQLGVTSALPGEKGYSPLNQLNFVKWNANATPRILKSVAEITAAEKNGELTIAKTNVVINSPVVAVVKSSK
ncbi:MAG: hypothetical protein ACJ71R_14380 [Nitrososphaeraceae archaeon]